MLEKMRRLTEDGAVVKGAAIGLLAISVVLALMGAQGFAFADKASEEGGAEETQDATSGIGEGSPEGAIKLGHVDVELISEDAEAQDGIEEGLAVGVPVARTYRIENTGEQAYVRLSSHTLFGNLDHCNSQGLVERPTEEVVGGEATDADDERSESSDEPEAQDGAQEMMSGEGEEEAGDDEAGSADPGDDDEDSQAGTAVPWVFSADGYWYRSVPLEAGQAITVDVLVGIPFEDRWVEALSTGEPSEVRETVAVSAIQARNIAIDLDGVDPWNLGDSASEEGYDESDSTENGSPDDGSGDSASVAPGIDEGESEGDSEAEAFEGAEEGSER